LELHVAILGLCIAADPVYPFAPLCPSGCHGWLGSSHHDAAKGNEARAAAQAELEVLMHATLTDPPWRKNCNRPSRK
jgi:hypothetical protein